MKAPLSSTSCLLMIIFIATLSVPITAHHLVLKVDSKSKEQLRHTNYPCRGFVIVIFVIFAVDSSSTSSALYIHISQIIPIRIRMRVCIRLHIRTRLHQHIRRHICPHIRLYICHARTGGVLERDSGAHGVFQGASCPWDARPFFGRGITDKNMFK